MSADRNTGAVRRDWDRPGYDMAHPEAPHCTCRQVGWTIETASGRLFDSGTSLTDEQRRRWQPVYVTRDAPAVSRRPAIGPACEKQCEKCAACGVPGTAAPKTDHIRSVPGGAAFLRVAAGLVDCGECRTQGCAAGKCRNAGVEVPRG